MSWEYSFLLRSVWPWGLGYCDGEVILGPSYSYDGPLDAGNWRNETEAVGEVAQRTSLKSGMPIRSGYAASHRAVREMRGDGLLPSTTRLRSSKYLNNLIEQDHRHIKSRVNVMLGFKRFSNAAVIIAGIELMHRIRKGQFEVHSALKETATSAVWNAVLFA